MYVRILVWQLHNRVLILLLFLTPRTAPSNKSQQCSSRAAEGRGWEKPVFTAVFSPVERINILPSMATRGAAKVGLCHNALSYRPFILAMVFFRLTSAFRACSFPMRNMNSRLWSLPKSDAAFSSQYSEMAIYSGDEEDIKSSLHLLAAKRPQLEVIMQSIRLSSSAAVDEIVWSAHCENLQVDCAILEPLFLGNSKLNCEMTAQGWDTYLTHRSRLLPTAPLEGSVDYPKKYSHCTGVLILIFF